MNELLKNKITEIISSMPKIQIATVFGSYAKGCNHADSDVDIAIAADKPIHHKKMMQIKTDLTVALDKDIDLIDLNAVNGLILKEALCSGNLILKKNTLIYANLIRKLIYYQMDMMPYYSRILKIRRENYFHA